MKRSLLLTAVLALVAAPLAAETFQIDLNHSKVMFRVRHMMVAKVSGRFNKFSGTFDYTEGKPGSWKTRALIEAASIDTGIEKRDGHLRTPDFFDVEKYPTLEFKSVKVTDAKGDKAKLHGELTLHGVTKPVVLDLEIGGVIKDPREGLRAGAAATGKISRKDFGLTWNQILEAGGVAVGDEVEITLEIEGTLKKG